MDKSSANVSNEYILFSGNNSIESYSIDCNNKIIKRRKIAVGLLEDQIAISENIVSDTEKKDQLVHIEQKLNSKVFDSSEFSILDPSTKILINNKGQYNLSEIERKEIIQQLNKGQSKKSESIPVSTSVTKTHNWPRDLVLSKLPDSVNDYESTSFNKNIFIKPKKPIGLSVVIPTFNRSNILRITLASISSQTTSYPFEVLVADDGSKENIITVVKEFEDKLDIKYLRRKDEGYQLCATRNLGIKASKYEYIAILDCDMAPNEFWVDSYIKELIEKPGLALIGTRRYVDTSKLNYRRILDDRRCLDNLPDVVTSNNVAGKTEGNKSVDWRIGHFNKTENLRMCNTPFRFFSGGNVAISHQWFEKVGHFDESFNHWGGEDNEFAYRLYRSGCLFKALSSAIAYHQEPPGMENETDRSEGKKITRQILENKVPFFYRKQVNISEAILHDRPLVSIYIPAYNCSKSIIRCIDSALNQTVHDLEVCVCDDGSTDDTEYVILKNYKNNPRVKYIKQENGGIGAASNTAVNMCKGHYIGQLDSDDYLEVDAVELCVDEFKKNDNYVCVYTGNRNIDSSSGKTTVGYNWPVYSREKLTTAMICHHFRMFTARAWHQTEGFDERIENAVDYDMYLKLSEVGEFKHLNKICYNRVLHGENTSIKNLAIQKENHFKVVNYSLKRQNIDLYKYRSKNSDDSSRDYIFENN